MKPNELLYGVCLQLCVSASVLASVNIALNKPADQSTKYFPASRAVDGNPSTNWAHSSCQHTFSTTVTVIAWWRVNITEQSRVRSVKIYNRSGHDNRIKGFRLYVSNTSEPVNSGHLCYNDDERRATRITDVDCNVVGQFVVIYMDKGNGAIEAVLNLCEVIVQGCPKNKFGIKNCNTTCHCAVGGCDPDTGLCDYPQYGCDAGWDGSSCSTECTNNTFGRTCGRTCHCTIGGCDPVMGICNDSQHGCIEGWDTSSCSECVENNFGINCNETCHCAVGGCDNVTGACDNPQYGCDVGWSGQSCSECDVMYFGSNCSHVCNCKTPGCDDVTGHCIKEGCRPGYRTSNSCTFSCLSPTYGQDCTSTCQCKEGPCDHVNGKCTIPGCLPGYSGTSCNTKCVSPRFGRDCRHHCHCAQGNCDVITGECYIRGCAAGFQGIACSLACVSPTYGLDCNFTCQCKVGPCNNVDGECEIPGCLSGFDGASCNRTEVQSTTKSNVNDNFLKIHVGLVGGIPAVLVLCLLVTTMIIIVLFRRRKHLLTRNDVRSTYQQQHDNAPTEEDGNIKSTKEPEKDRVDVKDRSGKKMFPVENYINLEMNSPADVDRVDNDYEMLSMDKQSD